MYICSGDHDMRMPYIATLDWIKSLNYTQIEKWHPWFLGDQIAGWVLLLHALLYIIIFQSQIIYSSFPN